MFEVAMPFLTTPSSAYGVTESLSSFCMCFLQATLFF